MTDFLWVTGLPSVALGLALFRTASLFRHKAPGAPPVHLVLALAVCGLTMMWAAVAVSKAMSSAGISQEHLDLARAQGPSMVVALAAVLYGPDLLSRLVSSAGAVLRRFFFLSKK